MPTPPSAPRSTVRRFNMNLLMTLVLLIQFADSAERGARRRLQQQALEFVTAGRELRVQVEDGGILSGRLEVTERVAIHAAGQAGAERGVVLERGAEAAGVRERLAVDLAARIDGLACIVGAVRADAVEVLQAEPDRIEEAVAGGALPVGPALAQPLAQRLRARGVGREDGIGVGRGRIHGLAKEDFADELSAAGRARRRPVRGAGHG